MYFKDLEHKLDMANDKYRTVVEDSREEKDQLYQDHKKDIKKLKVNYLLLNFETFYNFEIL